MARLIRADFPDQAWLEGIRLVSDEGQSVTARGHETLELRDITFEIKFPDVVYSIAKRNMAWKIAVLEGMSIIGQTSLPESMAQATAAFNKYRKHGVHWGSYGARLHGQLGLLLQTLTQDTQTRQAVLTIFDGYRDMSRSNPDIPCTIAIQFFAREALHMRVMMRSNDLWLGTPYDLLQFAMLQRLVAECLNMDVGEYVHTVGSMHLYKTDLNKALELTKNEDSIERTVFAGNWFVARDLSWADNLDEIAYIARSVMQGIPADDTRFLSWASDQVRGKRG